MHYESWCALSEEELGKRDIAEINLAAAFGLPCAGELDIPALTRKLDDWADLVDRGTRNAIRRRAIDSRDSEYSDAEYRMMALVTVLQLHLGVQYNFAFNVGDYDATDSTNLFIHGLLSGSGGTCTTMPVLYTAVGRRLGYPIKLVMAKGHNFCRWDDPGGERFNIEATSEGFNPRPDEFYLNWPEPISARDISMGWYMKNLSPREELAFFLAQRGHCWTYHLQTLRAVEASYYAHKLAPNLPAYRNEWAIAIILHRMVEEVCKQAKIDPRSTELRMPAPQTDWEEFYYPVAHKRLNSVLNVLRARRERVATNEALRELYTS